MTNSIGPTNSSKGYQGTLTSHVIDMERLFKLRVIVARYGEMDMAKWWNTNGQLGRFGAITLRRGFPRTHYFAQARSVFTVATHRCDEVFAPPGCVTLWRLPEAVEEEFETNWERWLDSANDWESFFISVAAIKCSGKGNELAAIMQSFSLVTDSDREKVNRWRRSAEGRAVLLPGAYTGLDDEITQLSLGFALGDIAAIAVPYMRCI